MNSPGKHSNPLGENWHAWVALAIGVLAVTAHSAASIVFSIVMKPMLADLGWLRAEFSGAMSARMLVMVAVMPLAGLFADRFGPRLVLAAGALVIGSGLIAITSVDSLREFYPLMMLMGPGQAGLGSVAASALVLRRFRRRRAIAIGILNGGDNVINSLVPLGTTALLAVVGWRGTLGTVGAVYVVLAALIAWALWPGGGAAGDADGEAARRVTFRDLPWGDVRLWLVCLSYACIYAFVASQQLHFHAYQTDIGRTPEQASTILSVQLLVGALGAPLFGWIAERTSARGTLVFVVAGLAAASVLLWSPHGYGFYLGWAVAYGTVNSGVVALLALVLAELFGAARIGRLMGVAMVFCMSATMLGNLYSAAVFDRVGSYAPVWQTYTALMVLTLVPTVALWRR